MATRSGFEADVYIWLKEKGVQFEYEKESYELWLPEKANRFECDKCGHRRVSKKALYTPDFWIKRPGKRTIVLETKGRFTALDRKKAAAMVAQYPEVDYRLLFMRDNCLTRTSKTRYSLWAEKHGIPAAVGHVPEEWI